MSTATVATPARLAASQSQVRVAHHHRIATAGLVHRSLHEIGLGLGGLDIGRAGPAVGQLPGVDEIEIVLDLRSLRGAGQDHGVTSILEVDYQVARPVQRLHLFYERHVEHPLGGPDVLSLGFLHLLAAQGLDQLVAAHADVTVDTPDRQQLLMLAKGPEPGNRVVEVGVDQRPVDVEDRGGGHAFPLP